MAAIGWLLIMVGVGAIIEGYNGHAVWQDIGKYLFKNANPPKTTGTTGTLV